MADGDDWKDGVSSDGAKEFAEYMAEITKHFVDALEAKGFTRAESIQLAVALVPMGGTRGK
jgi:hypothetical protein